MTWIKTIRPEEADPSLLELLQKTRAMYPPEYATPAPHVGGESIVVLAHADPPGDAPRVCVAGGTDAAQAFRWNDDTTR